MTNVLSVSALIISMGIGIWQMAFVSTSPKFVTVHMPNLQSKITKEFESRNIFSTKDISKSLKQLKSTLKNYAIRNNVMILEKAAIMAGDVEDITSEIWNAYSKTIEVDHEK